MLIQYEYGKSRNMGKLKLKNHEYVYNDKLEDQFLIIIISNICMAIDRYRNQNYSLKNLYRILKRKL